MRTMLGCLTALVLLSTAATAEAATYAGHFKGLPDSTIFLTFDRQGGRLYLDQLDWDGTPWLCQNGTDVLGASYYFDPPEGRVKHRGFRVRRTAPENNSVFRVAGELREQNNAKGELKFTSNGFDSGDGVCTTGALEWTASKGA